MDILKINIYFDFRSLYGENSLAEELWDFIGATIKEHPEFLLHFAEDALLYKPPITLFGNIALRDKGDDKETISLKGVISAIVQFARIYALKNQIRENNTLERLRVLKDKEFIKELTCRETSEVYSMLMHMRFKYQAKSMGIGDLPHNRINPKTLTDIEREILKKAFVDINGFQSKISYDFKGGV